MNIAKYWDRLRYYWGRFLIVAKMIRKKQYFYCRALAGESGYNISINSDLTVSCSCQDSLMEGQIGDIKVNTFKEIFYGEKATSIM